MVRRRSMLPPLLRPAALIRAQAFRKGLLGNNAFWRTIAMLLIGKRVMKRLFGHAPEIVEVSTLKGGGHWMEIRTYGPEARRARRREAS
jgi:hypothetical protein